MGGLDAAATAGAAPMSAVAAAPVAAAAVGAVGSGGGAGGAGGAVAWGCSAAKAASTAGFVTACDLRAGCTVGGRGGSRASFGGSVLRDSGSCPIVAAADGASATGVTGRPRRQASPTARLSEAATASGASQRMRGPRGGWAVAAACAAARMRASSMAPGSTGPCRGGSRAASAASSLVSGWRGLRLTWAAFRAVCPWHIAGATSPSPGGRR